jgi:hypothetical protein
MVFVSLYRRLEAAVAPVHALAWSAAAQRPFTAGEITFSLRGSDSGE